MSSTELRDILIKLRDDPKDTFKRFYRERIRFTEDIEVSRDWYILQTTKTSPKPKKYTIETFFMNNELEDEVVREAMDKLKDVILLMKLEEGTLKAREIISCRNIEIRRILFARFGYERFVRDLKATVVNKDGEQELMILRWRKDEEPINLVKVKDSTTGKYYLLRVPPSIRTCREAIAWTFGLSAEDYEPLKES